MLLFVLAIFLFLYLSFRAVAGVLGFIEHSRAMQRGQAKTIEAVEESIPQFISETVPTLAALSQGGSDASLRNAAGKATGDNGNSGSNSGNLTNPSDPTHILSGGRYLDATKPMLALTFDDGPKADVENQLMEALEAVDGRATFFMVGNRIAASSAHVHEMSEQGHEIANHSYSHDAKLSKKSVDYIREEFQKADAVIQEATGKEASVYRLPGGNISDAIRTAVGKPMIYWSVDTLDWKTRNADAVISEVRNHVQDGDIILMHSLYPSTAEACRVLLPELAAQGYQFVTVSELIALRGQDVSGGNGKQYSKFPPVKAAPVESSASENTSEGAASGSEDAAKLGNAEGSAVTSESSDPAAAGSETSAENKNAGEAASGTAASISSGLDTVLVGPGAQLSSAAA